MAPALETQSVEQEAGKVLTAMKTASETVRSAIASAIPVASNQVLTVAIPGTIINHKDFYYNANEHIKPPLAVQVQEARLVDGMIPLSKYTAGRTGKSVARSYLATLDFLVPIEASVSGAIGTGEVVTDERLKVIRNRYNNSMDYLKSPDEASGASKRTKVDTYVLKQSLWAHEVSAYAQAQAQAIKDSTAAAGAAREVIKEAREKYMEWLQEHGRDYKNNIQTKYMDWVVHGYKFMVDFHFGVVDISSGMKRIENSKEAFRNLTIIAPDGASEYQTVILTPSHWATIIKDKVEKWRQRNNKPTVAEIRAELRRLENLRLSHETLSKGIEDNAFFPILTNGGNGNDTDMEKAYAQVYASMDKENSTLVKPSSDNKSNRDEWLKKVGVQNTDETGGTSALEKLAEAQKASAKQSLERSNTSVRDNVDSTKKTAQAWISSRIEQIDGDIADLKTQLGTLSASTNPDSNGVVGGRMLQLPVVNENGVVVSNEEIAADPVISGKKPAPTTEEEEATMASPWTRVSSKSSRKLDVQETKTSQSASAVAAKAGWGLWSVSAGASHSSSSSEAMSSMSNLDVDITMDCMVVEIERPWLHAELFSDGDLDSGPFMVSPGEASLRKTFDEEGIPIGPYQQFSSYPTAFVVAADIELSFSGDTTSLESAVSASSTSANVSVGWGPFSVSGSHSSSKSKSKTKMESTATGCKISIQAPQIVGWVQTLLPELPKPKGGSSMAGLFH